jgi:pimeloyl-ACP methyl ester carboxylesterase
VSVAVINGARLAYDLVGRGPAVVFLHQGIADRTIWEREVADLSRDHRVLNLDQRGFGASELPPGPTAWHEDVAALMDGAGMGNATLVGGSFGAGVALDVALFRPDLVGALVLVGPSVGGREPSGDPPESVARIRELEEKGDLKGVADETLRLWLDGPSRPRGTVAGPIRERLLRINVEIARREATEWTKIEPRRLTPPAAERLASIRAPTLVVVGKDDVPFIVDNARFLAAGIRGAELAIIEDAAHLPNVDHPERFAELLRGFLARRGR